MDQTEFILSEENVSANVKKKLQLEEKSKHLHRINATSCLWVTLYYSSSLMFGAESLPNVVQELLERLSWPSHTAPQLPELSALTNKLWPETEILKD